MPKPERDASPGDRLAQRHLSPGVIDASQAQRPYGRAHWAAQRTSIVSRLVARYSPCDATGTRIEGLTFFGGRGARHDENGAAATVTTGKYSGPAEHGAGDPVNAKSGLSAGAGSLASAPAAGVDAPRAVPAAPSAAPELQRRLVSRKESAGVAPLRQVQRLYERSVTGAVRRQGLLDRLQARGQDDRAHSGAYGNALGEGGAVPVVGGIPQEAGHTANPGRGTHDPAAPSATLSADRERNPALTTISRRIEQTQRVGHDTSAGARAMGAARQPANKDGQAEGSGGPTSAESGRRSSSSDGLGREANSPSYIAAELQRSTGTAAREPGQAFRLSRKKSSPDHAGAKIPQPHSLFGNEAPGSDVQTTSNRSALSGLRERQQGAPPATVHGNPGAPAILSRSAPDRVSEPKTASGTSHPAPRAVTNPSAGGPGEGGPRLLLRKYGTYQTAHEARRTPESPEPAAAGGPGGEREGEVRRSTADSIAAPAGPLHDTRSVRSAELPLPGVPSRMSSPDNNAAAGPLILRKPESSAANRSDRPMLDPTTTTSEGNSAASSFIPQQLPPGAAAKNGNAIAGGEVRTLLGPLGNGPMIEPLLLRKPESNAAKQSNQPTRDQSFTTTKENSAASPLAPEDVSPGAAAKNGTTVAVGDVRSLRSLLGSAPMIEPFLLRKQECGAAKRSDLADGDHASRRAERTGSSAAAVPQNKPEAGAGDGKRAIPVGEAQGVATRAVVNVPLVLRKAELGASTGIHHREPLRERFRPEGAGTEMAREEGPPARFGADSGKHSRKIAESAPGDAPVYTMERQIMTPLMMRSYRGGALPTADADRAAQRGPGAGGAQPAPEISARSVRQDRPAMVWRTSIQQAAASAAAAVFRSIGDAAPGAAPAGTAGTAAGAGAATPVESAQTAGATAPGAASMDYEEIAEQVSRILGRRLETERERRGGGW